MSIDQVSFRPVAEDDLPFLERFLLDPEATGPFEWHGWRDPRRWRRRWAENALLDSEGGVLLVVSDDERVGLVAWRKIITGQGSYCWNVGINLLPEARGKGLGTQAQRHLVRYLFAHTQVARIEADTESANVAEQRSLEKAGFTREGVLRSYAFRDGEWRDAVIYSVLRSEASSW
ncbi:GNAT family N-acetyltransferase [Actinomadura livida]|uniref:GNAT family protein n=1 Tax=Actinomadura livida TaxID=79909 RepID=A0A7W7I8C3_9ACTN|nr:MULTISPECIES: GNAT family protein [Actinomadura]MBB4772330.1 RimJ/RimL family protein N-acetyltransferase [Actinomadura catellatispora]GGU23749.1 alanine acetyltransferase [Actinomadura livida]